MSEGEVGRRPLVSVDDHLVEPPGLWADDAPGRAGVPRVARDPATGGDVWVVGDRRTPLTDVTAAMGRPARAVAFRPLAYDDLPPACTDPAARVAALDRGGVLASLCFPSFAGGSGEALLGLAQGDPATARWCVERYDDWLFEAWCAPAGGRLVGAGLVPLWDPDLAVAQVARLAERGVRAVSLPPDPVDLGLPAWGDPDGGWERVLAACADAGVVACLHAQPPRGRSARPAGEPWAVALSLLAAGVAAAVVELTFAGVLSRHPHLRLLVVESEGGWLRGVVERMDRVWDVNRGWHGAALAERPRQAVQRAVWVGVSDLDAPITVDDVVRADRVVCEVDLPHTDSTWPETPEALARATRGLDPADIERIAAGNAAELLGLAPEALARWTEEVGRA